MTSEDKLGNDTENTPNEALAAKRRVEKSKKFADTYGGSGKLLKPETPERVRAQNAVFAEKFGKIDSVRAGQAENFGVQSENRTERELVPTAITDVDVDDLIKPNEQLLDKEHSEKLAKTMAKPDIKFNVEGTVTGRIIEEAAEGDPGELGEFLDTKLGESHVPKDVPHDLLREPVHIDREMIQKGLTTLKRMKDDPGSFNLGTVSHPNGTEELSVEEIGQLWADCDIFSKKTELSQILAGRLNMDQSNMLQVVTLADGRSIRIRWYHSKRIIITVKQ